MDNLPDLSTLCQCLHLLDFEEYRSVLDDHRAKKLFAGNTIQLHVAGQLLGLRSYDQITELLHVDPALRKQTGLHSISPSALARKTNSLCPHSLQGLFVQLVSQISALHQGKSLERIGPLRILDATEIRLPLNLANWAYCSKTKQGIKMHTRVTVVDSKHVYPDRIIATTADVNEMEVALDLVEDPDAIHVMDRGYQNHEHFEQWTKNGYLFVTRIRENTQFIVTRDFRIPKEDKAWIISDRKVRINKCKMPLRLVIFQDEQQREYYVLTNHFNLSAADLALVYKYRWQIELFFKWIKQHLRVVQVFSYSPTGIWNQLYLALIAFALCTLIQLKTQTKKTIWTILKRIRAYAHGRWEQLIQALNRSPTRTSKGSQVVERPPKEQVVLKKFVLK